MEPPSGGECLAQELPRLIEAAIARGDARLNSEGSVLLGSSHQARFPALHACFITLDGLRQIEIIVVGWRNEIAPERFVVDRPHLVDPSEAEVGEPQGVICQRTLG